MTADAGPIARAAIAALAGTAWALPAFGTAVRLASIVQRGVPRDTPPGRELVALGRR